jgi:hypothetical protein
MQSYIAHEGVEGVERPLGANDALAFLAFPLLSPRR